MPSAEWTDVRTARDEFEGDYRARSSRAAVAALVALAALSIGAFGLLALLAMTIRAMRCEVALCYAFGATEREARSRVAKQCSKPYAYGLLAGLLPVLAWIWLQSSHMGSVHLSSSWVGPLVTSGLLLLILVITNLRASSAVNANNFMERLRHE